MKRGTPDHPKVAALARILNIPKAHAVGLLEMLWHWTARFSPQGDIGKWTDYEIAAGAGWEQEPVQFLSALVRTNLVEDRTPTPTLSGNFSTKSDEIQTERILVIHDWHDHADDTCKKWLERKKLDFLSLPVQKVSGNFSTKSDTVTTLSGKKSTSGEVCREMSGFAPARVAEPLPVSVPEFSRQAEPVVVEERSQFEDPAPAKHTPAKPELTSKPKGSPRSTTMEHQPSSIVEKEETPPPNQQKTKLEAEPDTATEKPKQVHAIRQQYAEAAARKNALLDRLNESSNGGVSEPIKAVPNGNHETLARLTGVTIPAASAKPEPWQSLYSEADVTQVRDWLHEHCQANGETSNWPPPDNKICVGVLMAKSQHPLTAVYDWLFELRKRRQFPEQSYSWFVTLAAKHFVALPAAKVADCSYCADSGLMTILEGTVAPWSEEKHSQKLAEPCSCGRLPPVWWRDMYGDRALPETEEEKSNVSMPRRRV